MAELQLAKTHDLDALAKNIKEKTDNRFTLIDSKGLVIAESNKDKTLMDNHINRIEVQKANKEPYGISIRYSKTLDKDFLYVAKKISLTGKTHYLRMSISLKRIMDDFYTIWIEVALIFALFILIGFIVAYKMSRGIKTDVDKLINYLREVSKKNYKAVLKTSFSYEFINIASNLKSVIAKLERRERQRRKYTARLRLINKQRNDLLSALSHEFKNPLAAIQGYAETILHEPSTADNEKIHKRFLEKIMSNTQKISTMLDRIALSVKLENKDLTAQKDHFDLNTICLDAIAIIKKKFPDRTVIYEPKSVMVYMDKTMIEMVTINLLDNAMKYSDGDIRLKLTKKRLSVIDHGMGIEPAELEKITSKFYRVDKNTWDNSMGLGLSIVAYILNLHHTQLDIKSELGQGSVFSFKHSNLN